MSVEVRIAVISDIHGNLTALRAVLAAIDARGPFDRIVMGGDYCLNGPDPADSLDLALERGDDQIMGNTDRDIVNEGVDDPDLRDRKRMSIEWCRGQLGEQRIELLSRLKFNARITAPDGTILEVVHANPKDLDRLLFPELPYEQLAELLAGCDANVLVFGHLHIPVAFSFEGVRLFNVASCGAPRDGDRRAVWGEFSWSPSTGWQGDIRRVAYDYGDAVLRILDCGMPSTNRRIRDLLRATYA